MSTTPEQVGPYTIGAELGRGGMGVIYRARDARLGRDVAIKTLPHEFASNQNKMARFQREARVLASLNHPNIGAIYGMEEHEGAQFLVLEMVEGDTLSEHLENGPLPLPNAVSILKQIALAMEAAHDRQVIHRDLKPDNVKVTADRKVKLLDFGLAKEARSLTARYVSTSTKTDELGASASPSNNKADSTIADRFARDSTESGRASEHGNGEANGNNAGLTQDGRVIGTPLYMSPEQARGQTLDRRTDIWAFGCIVFECLTGHRAFDGKTAPAVMASILRDEPEWDLIPEDVPPALLKLVHLCLTKNIRDRMSTMLLAGRLLEDAAQELLNKDQPKSPGNLPEQLTTFVGRVVELAETATLLEDTRFLTLTGSGGCGKTRLGLELANQHGANYPEGVWLVELAALSDPELVLQAIAVALSIKEEAGSSLIDTLCDQIASKRLLLLLDNCEHLLEPCSDVASSLLQRCPDLTILASSRESLGVPGEVSYRVPSMKSPDPKKLPPLDKLLEFASISLFVERACAAVPSFSVTEENMLMVAQICNRLDGIPLAIELAAARVRMLTVEQIAGKLDDRFRLLTGGSRTALPRQQTLRSLIDWSYDHLTESEQAMLRSMSVFRGGWTLASAVAVHQGDDGDEFEALDLLTRLVDKSLVLAEDSAGEVRYRLLETIRQYARDRMIERAEAAVVRERHLQLYHELVAEAARHYVSADSRNWLDRIEREHDNIREAMDWCAGDPSLGQTALSIVSLLHPFWATRGYLREGEERISSALANSDGADMHARAKALDSLGRLHLDLGEFHTARDEHREALAIFQGLGDTGGIAGALLSLGNVTWRMGQLAEAEELLQRAVSVQRDHGDRSATASALRSLAIVKYRRGDMEQADELLREAVVINRRIGNEQGLSMILQLSALIKLRRGERQEARVLHEEALRIMKRIGYRPGIAMQLINLGNLSVEDGDYETGESYLGEALALSKELGKKVTTTEALGSLGEAAEQRNKLDVAQQRFTECLELCREIRDKQGQARALDRLAGLAVRQSDFDAARQLYGESLTLFHECGNNLEFGLVLKSCAQLQHVQGNPRAALELLIATDAVWTRGNVTRSSPENIEIGELRATLLQSLTPESYEAGVASAATLEVEGILARIDPDWSADGAPHVSPPASSSG